MQHSPADSGLNLQEIIDHIKDLVRGSWRYRWQAVIVAWLVCIVAWTAVLMIPDRYRASSRLVIDADDSLPRLLRDNVIPSNFLDEVNVMLKSILSRPTLEQIATVSGFDIGDRDPAEIDAMIGQLRDRLEIDLNREKVLEVAIEHSNPKVAYAVVDVLIDLLVENLLGATTSDARSTQEFLKKKLAEYEALLNEAEARLADFKKKNIGLMPGERGGYYARLQQEMAELEEFDSKIKLARQRRNMLEDQMAGEEPVFGLVAGGGATVTSPQIELLESQLTELRLQYTDQHPDVLRTQELLDELRQDLIETQPDPAASVAASVDRNPVYQQMKIQFSQADLELSQLETARAEQARTVTDLKQRIDTIPEIEAELTRLNRNYDVYRTQHTELVEALEKARMSEDVKMSSTGLNFRVIDPPSVGSEPVGPDRRILITLGLLVALGLGVGLTALRSFLTPVFYSAQRLERMFGTRVLGTIKLVATPQEASAARRGVALMSLSILLLLGCYAIVLVFDRTGAALAGRIVGQFG